MTIRIYWQILKIYLSLNQMLKYFQQKLSLNYVLGFFSTLGFARPIDEWQMIRGALSQRVQLLQYEGQDMLIIAAIWSLLTYQWWAIRNKKTYLVSYHQIEAYSDILTKVRVIEQAEAWPEQEHISKCIGCTHLHHITS